MKEILEGRRIFLLIPWLLLLSEISAIRVDLYLNKDKFGEFLRLDLSEKGCTNVPLNWDNQAISLDTHGSCVKFYDMPYCRGKYVALQPYHGTFQDNLDTLGFKQLISSASPCGPKVPSGRYYILNGADGSVLTINMKNTSVVAKTLPFKPYITKNQQFQIDKISVADYEIIPRVHEDLNPLTFDMSISSKQHPVRRTWKIESVYRGKYVIKNEWNNRCLYKSESGKVDEHECIAWSPNQEWMFKSIKIQPFFPSKDQLVKKPIRPEEQLPFDPQQEVNIFPNTIPHPPHPEAGESLYIPKDKKKEPLKDSKPKDSDEEENSDEEEEDEEEEDEDNANKTPTFNKPHVRPNPIVLNPREPFPPVQPHGIYPKGTQFLPPIGPDGKPDFSRPPVPQVRHPGDQPFPRQPVVTDPKKPIWPPTLFGSFGPTPPTTTVAPKPKEKTSEEEDDDEADKDDAEDEKEETDKDDAEDEKEETEKDDAEDEKEDTDKDDAEDEKEEGTEKDDADDDKEEADDAYGEQAEEEEEYSRERYDISSEE